MLRLDSVVFVSSPVELPMLPLTMNTEFSAGTSVRAIRPASWTEPSSPGGFEGSVAFDVRTVAVARKSPVTSRYKRTPLSALNQITDPMRSITRVPPSTEMRTACGLISCQSSKPGIGVCPGAVELSDGGALEDGAVGGFIDAPGETSPVGRDP